MNKHKQPTPLNCAIYSLESLKARLEGIEEQAAEWRIQIEAQEARVKKLELEYTQ